MSLSPRPSGGRSWWAHIEFNPPGKLADAELHFTDGVLAGLKLVGFAVWERRNGVCTVTFPARRYAVNG